MRRTIVSLALLAVPALGQDDKASRREDILAALELPARAQALRDKGVDRAQVKEAMQAARSRKLKAKETRDLMKESETAVDEHGPVDDFGAFVKGKLDSGLRGRELAAAIKAEHAARGKGKGHGKKGGVAKEHDAKGKAKEKEERKEEEKEEGRGEEEEEGKGKPEKERGEGRGGGKPEKEQEGGKGQGKGKGK